MNGKRLPGFWPPGMLGLISLAACVAGAGLSQAAEPQAVAATVHATGGAVAQGASTDAGDVQVLYTPSAQFEQIKDMLEDAKLLEIETDNLNTVLALPADLRITFMECGQAHASYDPVHRQLAICYELIEDAAQNFTPWDGDDAAYDKAVINVTAYVFLHELGHALTDLFHLPVTAHAEGAIDQLAAYVLVESGEEGQQAALDAAAWFLARAQDSHISEWPFWREHSLDASRFSNLACWVYGTDSEGGAGLVQEGCLPDGSPCVPEGRAQSCQMEYQQLAEHWEALLAPYLKADHYEHRSQ